MKYKKILLVIGTDDSEKFETVMGIASYLEEPISQINELKESCSRTFEFCEAVADKYVAPGNLDENSWRNLLDAISKCGRICDKVNKTLDDGFDASSVLVVTSRGQNMAEKMKEFASNIACIVNASRQTLSSSFGDVCDFIPMEDENFKKKSRDILSSLMIPEMTNGRYTKLDADSRDTSGGHSCNLGGGN